MEKSIDLENGFELVVEGDLKYFNYERELISSVGKIKTRIFIRKKKAKLGGCYQITFCNECLAYPMGIDCPNENAKNYLEELKNGKD